MKHKRRKPSTVREVGKKKKRKRKGWGGRKAKGIKGRKKERRIESTEIENITVFKTYEKISYSYKLRIHWLEIEEKPEYIS